jgi:hypothetical protein
VLVKKNLPQEVIDAILHHWDYARKHYFACAKSQSLSPSDQWIIKETATEITGTTFMDNFDMQSFIEELFHRFDIPYFHYERDGG